MFYFNSVLYAAPLTTFGCCYIAIFLVLFFFVKYMAKVKQGAESMSRSLNKPSKNTSLN